MKLDDVMRWTVAAAGAALLAGCGYSSRGGTELERPRPVTEARQDKADQTRRTWQRAGYTVGSIHPADVSSVYVEIFQSQEFRRELEFRLSEALAKRIIQDTPYKIAPKNSADTILYGEITTLIVTNLGNDFDSDLPREIQQVLVCNWTWKNRRTGEVLAYRVGMKQTSESVPLAGMTFFDGTEEGIDDLAERIVEAMESEW